MGRKEPWFKLWANDYLTDPDVDELSLEAQGLLLRMWCVCSQRGNIPNDPEEIARLTRCKLQCVLQCHLQCRVFFELRNGLLYSGRMEREKEKSDKARSNAEKRYNKEDSAQVVLTGSANGNAIRTAQKARKQDSQIQEQKPLCGKRDVKPADERHQPFKAAIGDYWAAKNPGIDMPWDGSEGKALGMFLSASPHLDLKAFVELLRSRFKSEVNHSDRPSMWIRSTTSFGSGPIDRFGKPMNPNGGTGNGKANNSPTKQRVDANRRAVAETAIKLGWISPDSFDGGLGAAVSESGYVGRDAGVHDGLRPVGPEILAPEGSEGSIRFAD
jgi:uncharacterized protein YdaU (DUF1376 family)